jgi:hypothetical protein
MEIDMLPQIREHVFKFQMSGAASRRVFEWTEEKGVLWSDKRNMRCPLDHPR